MNNRRQFLQRVEDCRRLPETVLALAKDPAAARAKAAKARAFVEQRQRETMQVVKESLNG